MRYIFLFILSLFSLNILALIPEGDAIEINGPITVFLGTVKSIKRTHHKEGEFDLITFKVDSIIKMDTITHHKMRRFLYKKRNRAFVMDSPSEHSYKIGLKYIVYVDKWNVDYYSSNHSLTKLFE